MKDKPLSPREEQIVQLAVDGQTNDAIAHKLGLSLSTVNSYWMRIRIKVQADSRTAAIARLINDKAEAALRAAEVEKQVLADEIERRKANLHELHAALALLQLAMDQMRSAVWSTDRELCVIVFVNGEIPAFDESLDWAVDHTIYQVFRTDDPSHPAVAAHLIALNGNASETMVKIDGGKVSISVRPLKDEDGSVIGCLGSMTTFAGDA